MIYQKKDYQALYEAMAEDLKARLPEMTDFEPGSVVRSLLETIAFEQSVFYEQLDYVYNASFVNTAASVNLEKVVAILDVKRNEPDFTTGVVTFTKEADAEGEVIIPIGTLVVTEDNPDEDPVRKAFLTIEEGRMGEGINTVEVKVQAEIRGPKMATKLNTVVVMPRPISGVESVTNTKDIRFLGRDRETDEELRSRAKNTLLAAGRASNTSIEQALLAMPNILDVKILENEERPGVIEVYVDGLTQDNSKTLATRLDEVRAAGIYARLKPADRVKVMAVVKLQPHESVISDELVALEQQVTEAVVSYIRDRKMGEPLSLTRLTSEMLNVKGVQDVERMQIVLQPREVRQDGKLIITDVVGVENPEEQEVTFLLGKNAKGERVYQVPSDPKNIRNLSKPEVSRFVPTDLRIVAEMKPLPIQFHIKVKYPNAQSLGTIQGKINAALAGKDFTAEEFTAENELGLSKTVLDKYLKTVNAYFAQVSQNLADSLQSLRVDPMGDAYAEFLSWMRSTSGLSGEQAEPYESGEYAMDEAQVKTKYYALAEDKSSDKPADKKNKMNRPVREALQSILEAHANQALAGFPESDFAANLLADATVDLRAKLDTLKREIISLNQNIANHQLKIVNKPNDAKVSTWETTVTNAQKDLVKKQKSQDDLQSKISNITNGLKNLMAAWSKAVQQRFLDLVTDKNLNTFTQGISKITDFDLSLRLRTTNFENR
ncbi:MAG: baseplate J/gp47 family protein, partial [Bacteroidota bacterium]